MVIWKFELSHTSTNRVAMPTGAVILDVQVQCGKPTAWVLCDPSAEAEFRTFSLFHTGEVFDDEGLRYVGTFQKYGGAIVVHAFERVSQ